MSNVDHTSNIKVNKIDELYNKCIEISEKQIKRGPYTKIDYEKTSKKIKETYFNDTCLVKVGFSKDDEINIFIFP